MSDQPKLGDRSDAIGLFANTLNRLGFLTAPSDVFDEKLTQGIKAFQQARGLTATGVINEITARVLEEARFKLGDRILSFNQAIVMRGDDVSNLQARLIQMGFNCGKVDGIYGANTEVAVKEFQKSVGILADGKCGPVTLIALMRLVKTVSGGAPSALRENVRHAVRSPALANKVIVLDPSWGGEFTGENENGVVEAEVVFDLAQRLEGRLIALGVNVVLTRSAKNSPLEKDRIQVANSVSADLVIALKVDTYKNENANGVATYYYGRDDQGVSSVVGARFANLLQREICARTDLLNCRTHAKSWDLLRLTQAPTVRIDLGYLSNPKDAKRLATPTFRDTLAEAMIVAIQRLYLSEEDDAKTGTLKISDLRRAGLRN
ncbi:MAG: N-acetylmuramoyl-L-alanine amidase [Candidatus Nanopelagicus sp.]|jgi:N-acetylmuramoyl-L-alanine amidase|nr:N-acetylmuramoyl-L-alanine amidase [Candidatus Nanopelagicus sp.]